FSEREQGLANDRVVCKALDDQGVRRLDLDLVVGVDSLQRGDHFVLPAGALRSTDEREVDLGVRSSTAHASNSASWTNSLGSSSSARAVPPCPIEATAVSTPARDASPESAIELPAVLRRCAKAASTTGLTSEIGATTARSKATSAESTRGCGRNTDGETGWNPTFWAES